MMICAGSDQRVIDGLLKNEIFQLLADMDHEVDDLYDAVAYGKCED